MNDELNNEANKLCLKTVYDLLGQKFYIPSYQRGYRWSEGQVKELLNDIWDFSKNRDVNSSSFYCLQPVVVVQDGEQWQVVDGQQRLTTIYIILHYLEKEHLRRDLSDAYKKPAYTLEYETRKNSGDFLKNILPSEQVSNIDFYHIAQAYEVVSDWFNELDYSDCDDFIKTLLGKADKHKSVQVIWYDLSDECKDSDYAIDVFSRINIGKIPLTNAELIKALFLQQHDANESNATIKQIQIASEWDAIEKGLQNSEFWYFISNSKSNDSYATRIEFIFDLMMGKYKGAEKLYTFHQFNALLKACKKEEGGVERIWKSVKDYFLTFSQWFEDRELYHLIGFLVDCGSSIVEIKKQSELTDSTKTEFKAYLKNEIKKEVKVDIDTLEYGDKKLKSILLLFNIQTLLATNDADVRFPFDRYKTENWDIEHIRSQTDKDINGQNRNLWLEDVLEYFTGSRDPARIVDVSCLPSDLSHVDLVAEVRDLLLTKKIDDSSFKALYLKVASVFYEKSDNAWTDSLGNLALLDATTNRSYGNAMFPIKRKRIIANDMRGVFVPICTKNVFLKYYSKKMADVMYWQESDANDYLEAIKEILIEYLPKQDANYE
jgi:uncharacterized protein with ParB-like and HNH nuclease domain